MFQSILITDAFWDHSFLTVFSPSRFFFQSPSPQPAFILQPTSLVTQPPKTKEPPRYEDAVKQSRNLHINNISQVRCTPPQLKIMHTDSTAQNMPYISSTAVLSCCIL